MHSYVVAQGDTLWLIAKRFGVSLEDMIKGNPGIKDPNKIAPGDRVAIPLPEDEGFMTYAVQNGDTMWSIARKFDLPRDILVRANEAVENGDFLSPGCKLRIPAEKPDSAGLRYTVQPGDSYWSIAGRFGLSLSTLLRANPEISDEEDLRPGQVLQLPRPTTRKDSCDKQLTNHSAVYYVKNGDVLLDIAQRYAMKPDQLAAVNPQIRDMERLNGGMQLYLPGFHYVKAGESLYDLAEGYGVSLESLLRANSWLIAADAVGEGDKLAIPRRENGEMALYTVNQGDTLYKIAQRYNIAVEAILRVNPDVSASDLIYPCQTIIIPGPHFARKGQTTAEIARLYGVDAEALLRLNPGLGDAPALWQSVRIPDAEKGSCRQKEEPEAEMGREVRKADTAMGVDYVVQSGDTMYGIASMYHVAPAALIAANPEVTDADRITPGMMLHVPTGYVECVCHMVKRGETVWRIAAMYRLRVDTLLAANPQLKTGDDLCPGGILMIPIRCGDEEKRQMDTPKADNDIPRDYPEIYIVQTGDTLGSIAARFGITGRELRIANEAIGEDEEVFPGQELIVLPGEGEFPRGSGRKYGCIECPWFRRGLR